MAADFEGFYASYFTGAMGSTLGLFCFKEGNVAGVDVGGGKYNGSYTIDPTTKIAHCLVHFVLTLGSQSITGAMAATAPISLSVPVALPLTIKPTEVFRIETEIGPINARFDRLRGL